MRKTRKRWQMCPMCGMMIYTSGGGHHTCPEKVAAERQAELDSVIAEEMSTWDKEVEKFWNSRDVKFLQHLIDEGKL